MTTTVNDFKSKMIEAISNVKKRMNTEHGFVVCNDDYVTVGEEQGMNGTGVAFNCITSAVYAIVYPTTEDAWKFGQDFYLVNGKGEVCLQIVKAETYFESQIKKAEELIKFMDRRYRNH